MIIKIEMSLADEAINKFNGLGRAATGRNGSFLDLLETDIEAAPRKHERLARVDAEITP